MCTINFRFPPRVRKFWTRRRDHTLVYRPRVLTRISMKAHIKPGRVFGIEVGRHLSWFTIALLITMSLANQFHAVNPEPECGLGDRDGPSLFLHDHFARAVARDGGNGTQSTCAFDHSALAPEM